MSGHSAPALAEAGTAGALDRLDARQVEPRPEPRESKPAPRDPKPESREPEIVRCDDSYRGRWNSFVDATPEASFYHRYEWREINRASFGHQSTYLATVEGEKITGVLPLVRVKSALFGSIGCSMPFVNYGGPVAANAAAEAALMREAVRVADDWRVSYLELRSRRYLGDAHPSADHKVSMTIDLNPDPDVLWAGFKTGHRQDIRRAYKNGLTAKVGGLDLLDDFYAILSTSWRDLGTPIYRKSYFASIIAAFPGAVRVLVVYAGDKPVATAFDGVHAGTVEGMWLGMLNEHRKDGVGYVIYWELIKNACENGYRSFHLGRSTAQSGGETFKKKWNAQGLQLHWHYILRARRDLPQLNVQNPKYQAAINAWRRLPLPVTQAIGPFVARCIP